MCILPQTSQRTSVKRHLILREEKRNTERNGEKDISIRKDRIVKLNSYSSNNRKQSVAAPKGKVAVALFAHKTRE